MRDEQNHTSRSEAILAYRPRGPAPDRFSFWVMWSGVIYAVLFGFSSFSILRSVLRGEFEMSDRLRWIHSTYLVTTIAAAVIAVIAGVARATGKLSGRIAFYIAFVVIAVTQVAGWAVLSWDMVSAGVTSSVDRLDYLLNYMLPHQIIPPMLLAILARQLPVSDGGTRGRA